MSVHHGGKGCNQVEVTRRLEQEVESSHLQIQVQVRSRAKKLEVVFISKPIPVGYLLQQASTTYFFPSIPPNGDQVSTMWGLWQALSFKTFQWSINREIWGLMNLFTVLIMGIFNDVRISSLLTLYVVNIFNTMCSKICLKI